MCTGLTGEKTVVDEEGVRSLIFKAYSDRIDYSTVAYHTEQKDSEQRQHIILVWKANVAMPQYEHN